MLVFPDNFIRLCSLSQVPKRFGKRFELDDDVEIALFHVDGELLAVDNICPHQRAPLIFEGDVENGTVACPMHGWTYDLRTGECVSGGLGRLKTYAIRVEGDDVWIERPERERPRWMD